MADLETHAQSVLLPEPDHMHSTERLDRRYLVERGAVHEKPLPAPA